MHAHIYMIYIYIYTVLYGKKSYQKKTCTTIFSCASRKRVVHAAPDSCAMRRAQLFVPAHGGQRQDSCAHKACAQGLRTTFQRMRTTVHKACAQGLRTRPEHKAGSLPRTTPAHKADPCVHNVFFYSSIQYSIYIERVCEREGEREK